jgi:uncharacterized protein (UPF0297 family)
MTTELPQQIKNINHQVKYKYGDIYAEQVNEVINDVYHNLNIKTTIGLVDFVEYIINDDYKQPQINALKKDVKTLQEENKVLKEEIKELKQDNIILKNNNDKLTKQVNILEQNKLKFDALVKLHECNALVNKEFKKLYRIKFNKNKYDNNIPNIGDFINDPPTEDDEDNYQFWNDFNTKYPQSDDVNFRLIYQKIANDRSDSGAHVNVRKLNKTDFDKLIELVYPEEYKSNKDLYEKYRDWLFMFPA